MIIVGWLICGLVTLCVLMMSQKITKDDVESEQGLILLGVFISFLAWPVVCLCVVILWLMKRVLPESYT